MTNNIYEIGLNDMDLKFLEKSLPLNFQIYICEPEIINEKTINKIINDGRCIIADYKNLDHKLMRRLCEVHKENEKRNHAPLLFIAFNLDEDEIPEELLESDLVYPVDLKDRWLNTWDRAIKILRMQSMPTWQGMNSMRDKSFDGKWYLLDLITSGYNALDSDILAICIAEMENRKINNVTTHYIKQQFPISNEVEEETGITNEILAEGEELSEVLEIINGNVNIPFIVANENRVDNFMTAAYHKVGMQWKHPYISLDGLCAILYGQRFIFSAEGALAYMKEHSDEYPFMETGEQWLDDLYNLTFYMLLDLEKRYDLHSAGELEKLYAAKIISSE